MRLTAAAAAVWSVAVLLSVSAALPQTDWSITYSSVSDMCALKGSTVKIHSSYSCTSSCTDTKVERTFWFTHPPYGEPVDLRARPEYAGRVQYHCENNFCTLTITDVRKSDSALYKFRLITNQPGGRYAGTPGVKLTVTDLQVQKSKTGWCSSPKCEWAELNCQSSCLLDSTSYIWYENGKKIHEKKKYENYLYAAKSYSCVVNGREDVPSPSLCGYGSDCNKVTYTDRRICTFPGSSVDLSCTYNSYYSATSKFWFRSYQDPTEPEDIREDSRYRQRVGVSQTYRRSTLRISDLTIDDSAEYRFKFKSRYFEWESSLPGITLTVQEPDLEVQVIWSAAGPKLICHSSCVLSGHSLFTWYRNDTQIWRETSSTYKGIVDPAFSYSCAYQNHKTNPVYVPAVPRVSKSFSGDIIEKSSVTLNCSSDANPRASYTWYKNKEKLPREDPQLVFSSIQSSDAGEYRCVAGNELGNRTSQSVVIYVKYAPKLPSVSVSPSAEIVEGSSVNLTCSSDANPAASYTWYKENQTLFQGPEGKYHFPSISSEDRGNYYCKSENQYGEINSTSLFLDVQYAPKFLSVSVSPSAEIVEGSSVTLTCSSDANPAASYTWYKEDEDSPGTSGQIFTITDFTAEHSGNYYCEAWNSRGRQNSTLRLTVAAGALASAAAGTISVVLLVLIVLAVFLWIRKNKFFVRQSLRGGARPDTRAQPSMSTVYDVPPPSAGRRPAEQQDDLHYSTIHFSPNMEDALYSNITAVRPRGPTEEEKEEEEEDGVEYTTVNTHSSDTGRTSQEAAADLFALYSTVKK